MFGKLLCDIECGAWVGLCCFILSHSISALQLLAISFWLIAIRLRLNWCVGFIVLLVRHGDRETERQRVCWCVFCYFCWTENIGKKSIGSKVFLETYVFVEAPTNWLKCSDIVWIMSIDKSSFAFRCFSLTFCTYLPLSAWMYFVLIFLLLYSILGSSFGILSVVCMNVATAGAAAAHQTRCIFISCAHFDTEVAIGVVLIGLHYVTEKNDRGYDSCVLGVHGHWMCVWVLRVNQCDMRERLLRHWAASEWNRY